MVKGFLCLTQGAMVESAADDHSKKINLTDINGNTLPNDIYSIAFDRDGYLWVGTSEGVIVSYNPEDAANSSSFVAQRVKNS